MNKYNTYAHFNGESFFLGEFSIHIKRGKNVLSVFISNVVHPEAIRR